MDSACTGGGGYIICSLFVFLSCATTFTSSLRIPQLWRVGEKKDKGYELAGQFGDLFWFFESPLSWQESKCLSFFYWEHSQVPQLLSMTSIMQGSLMEAMYSADLPSLVSSSSHLQSHSTGQGSEGDGRFALEGRSLWWDPCKNDSNLTFIQSVHYTTSGKNPCPTNSAKYHCSCSPIFLQSAHMAVSASSPLHILQETNLGILLSLPSFQTPDPYVRLSSELPHAPPW